MADSLCSNNKVSSRVEEVIDGHDQSSQIATSGRKKKIRGAIGGLLISQTLEPGTPAQASKTGVGSPDHGRRESLIAEPDVEHGRDDAAIVAAVKAVDPIVLEFVGVVWRLQVVVRRRAPQIAGMGSNAQSSLHRKRVASSSKSKRRKPKALGGTGLARGRLLRGIEDLQTDVLRVLLSSILVMNRYFGIIEAAQLMRAPQKSPITSL